MTRARGGTSLVTTDPAATKAPAPTVTPLRTIAPMPIRQPSSRVAPWTTARWPMVTSAPISTGWPGSPWSTAPSWTLLPSPMTIGQTSARATAVGQRLAPAASWTSPISTALSATQASGWTDGVGHGALAMGVLQTRGRPAFSGGLKAGTSG